MNAIFNTVLGEASAITITSPQLKHSLEFYSTLGFAEVLNLPSGEVQVSDGSLLINLSPGKNSSLSLSYYSNNPADIFRKLGENIGNEGSPSDDISKNQPYTIRSPDGLEINLLQLFPGIRHPAGPGMLSMSQDDYFNPDKYTNPVCGMFGELAQPVSDLEKSADFWQKLGFSILSKFESPYPWAILSDGLQVIGLHQTRNFTQPAITYFASDMKDKIENIRKKGVTEYTSKGSGNIVVMTPEKQHINLFRLGM